MAKLTWKVYNSTQATDITQYVRSISYTLGRPNAVSPYAGGSFSFTMTNTSNQATYAQVQDFIRIAVKGSGAYSDAFVGYVSQREYQDGPGTALNSTVTISGVDEMSMFGPENNIVAAAGGYDLLDKYSAASYYGQLTGFTNISMLPMATPNNALQAVNNVIAGDGGVVSNRIYYPPQDFDQITQTNFTFGNTISASQIGYQTFNRVEATANGTFFTAATVTNQNGGSPSTASAVTSIILYYGARYLQVTTAESSLTDTASWYANAFSDPAALTLLISFTDVAQNATALDFLPANLFNEPSWTSLSYTPPGGSPTSGYFWPEQLTVNADPSQTTVNLVMSPISYYGRFTLNDAVFGVLDIDRLGVS